MNDNDKALVAQQGNLIQNFDDVNRIGKAMAASGYFKDAANVAQAIVKIMAGREMGFGPFASMNGINIIKGKPSVGANLMAAAIKGHPSYDYRLLELTPTQCVIAFFENGQKIGESHFTIKDAKKAGVGSMTPPGKPASMLEMFPRNLLFSRAISNGVRWYCPDVFAGNVVYTPDELDMGVETIDAPAIIVEAEIAESDSGEVADSPRPKKSLPRPYPAEIHDAPENPDIEALEIDDGSFYDAALQQWPYYKAQRHVANTLTAELGDGWWKDDKFTKSQLWMTLALHQEKASATATPD
ncbi:MAG: hypothetical protein DRJ03_13170 [Chloroflexi bacterium]|nr:MAG: hypothetical protein DRJ03_13170 [Chloroflexota bacterium]